MKLHVLMMTSSNENRWPVNSPNKRALTRNFDVFFGVRLNKWLSKHPWGWWFEMPSRPLTRHSNVLLIENSTSNIVYKILRSTYIHLNLWDVSHESHSNLTDVTTVKPWKHSSNTSVISNRQALFGSSSNMGIITRQGIGFMSTTTTGNITMTS